MDPLLLDGSMDTAALARAIREQKKKAAEDAEQAKLQAERAERAQERKAQIERQSTMRSSRSVRYLATLNPTSNVHAQTPIKHRSHINRCVSILSQCL